MKRNLIIRLLLFTVTNLVSLHSINAQNIFYRYYGGSDKEGIYQGLDNTDMEATSDGGYICVGGTRSFIYGVSLMYIVKTNSLGDTLWTKAIGDNSFGSDYFANSIKQTADNGYIVAGYNYSSTVVLLKLDNNGNTKWIKEYYADARTERGCDVEPTRDGGYIIATSDFLYGPNNTGMNGYLIKTDGNGNQEWTRNYGGVGNDVFSSIRQTSDGGYIACGRTTSFGNGKSDVFLVKTNESGIVSWVKTFGGAGTDEGYAIRECSDKGFIIGGMTMSFGSGYSKAYLIRTNSNGYPIWEKQYGATGISYHSAYSVEQTRDAGFILTGVTSINSTDNILLIKTGTVGQLQWAEGFGGPYVSNGYAVKQTQDGGYIIGGWGSNPVLGLNSTDLALIKTDSDGYLGCARNRLPIFDSSIIGTVTIPIDMQTGAGSEVYLSNYGEMKGGKVTTLCTGVMAPGITIQNVIQNNSTFSQPKLLWTGTARQTPATIKVCADASAATEFIYTNASGIQANNIRFRIASDPYGDNADLFGAFLLANYAVNGNTIKVKFTHPKYLPAIYKPFRIDEIQIVDIGNSAAIIYTIPIEIYRAPVVMVHGLWGNIESFSDMDAKLDTSGYYPTILTYNVDYSFTNAASFYRNRNIVPSNINTILGRLRTNGYSAGKVDVIGHSMGGLLSRYYLQSKEYGKKQDMHKLITLNTPHSGSPLGNLLSNKTSLVSAAAQIAGEPIAHTLFNSSIYNGAIQDLSINSVGMNFLNNTMLNNGIVPSHSIITKNIFSDDHLYYLILAAAAPVAAKTVDAFTDFLFFGDQNDLAVAVPSQSGGLPLSATTTIPGQLHIGSPSNYDVLNTVINGLNTNPSDAIFFSQNGFAPVTLNSRFRPLPSGTSSKILTGSLQFNSPSPNQYFNPGDVVPVHINAANGVNRIIFEAINLVSNSYILDTVLSGGIINYTVPANAFGKIKLIALGYDDGASTLVGYDTLSIFVSQNTSLDSIAFYHDTLYTQINNSTSAAVIAYFNNGRQYNVGRNTDIQFQLLDTSIASLRSANIIHAKMEGSTILTAIYAGKTAAIPVQVIAEDTTLRNLIFRWTGTFNTEWTEGNNWSAGVIPAMYDEVIIPAGTPFSPTVPAGINAVCKSISILPGAVVNIASNANLTVTNQY